jgi:hypothetical protein
MTYTGTLICSLHQVVARRDPLRWYVLQNSSGRTHGDACEMLESEGQRNNIILSEACSDYRWVIVAERGAR